MERERQNSRGSSDDLIKGLFPVCCGVGGRLKHNGPDDDLPSTTSSSPSVTQHGSHHSCTQQHLPSSFQPRTITCTYVHILRFSGSLPSALLQWVKKNKTPISNLFLSQTQLPQSYHQLWSASYQISCSCCHLLSTHMTHKVCFFFILSAKLLDIRTGSSNVCKATVISSLLCS